MIEAYKQISKRLERFIEDHLEYYDDGDPESGPHLSSNYDGPEWAIRLDMISIGEYDFWALCAGFDEGSND